MKFRYLTALVGVLLLSACQVSPAAPPTKLPSTATPALADPATIPEVDPFTPTAASSTQTSTPDAVLEALLALPGLEVTAQGDADPGTVNLRAGPGAVYPITGKVKIGTTFTALAITEHGEWLVLRHPGDENLVAWIYIHYTTYDPAQKKLPIIHNLPPTPVMKP